ncbi:hypothetical protein [Methylorubrum extorquens]|uniref:hypothetical protein n=1 Tax=Methylorubrum extorquens TaxID=408 RepID=UPI0012376E29|nr:hypothetical protein [Methylorubrum extorquens]WIU40324.1 hypothetical protein KQ926_02915 [Methylorubrum extorquens]
MCTTLGGAAWTGRRPEPFKGQLHSSLPGGSTPSRPRQNGLRKISGILDSRFDKFSRAGAPIISTLKREIGDQFETAKEAFR